MEAPNGNGKFYFQLIDTRNIDMKSAPCLNESSIATGQTDLNSALRLVELGDALRETKNSSGNNPDNPLQPRSHA
jgi:hypothetical protein